MEFEFWASSLSRVRVLGFEFGSSPAELKISWFIFFKHMKKEIGPKNTVFTPKNLIRLKMHIKTLKNHNSAIHGRIFNLFFSAES